MKQLIQKLMKKTFNLKILKNGRKPLIMGMKSLKNNDTWKLLDSLKGAKSLFRNFVYCTKSNLYGTIDKFKARVEITGYNQRKINDYKLPVQ